MDLLPSLAADYDRLAILAQRFIQVVCALASKKCFRSTQSLSAQCVGLACYTVLIYDILLTIGDEVQYMWKWRMGLCERYD